MGIIYHKWRLVVEKVGGLVMIINLLHVNKIIILLHVVLNIVGGILVFKTSFIFYLPFFLIIFLILSVISLVLWKNRLFVSYFLSIIVIIYFSYSIMKKSPGIFIFQESKTFYYSVKNFLSSKELFILKQDSNRCRVWRGRRITV